MKTKNPLTVAANVAALQAEISMSEVRDARESKRERDALANSRILEQVDRQFEADELRLDIAKDKAIAGLVTSPFGAVGTIANSITSIVINETKGARANELSREAGLLGAAARRLDQTGEDDAARASTRLKSSDRSLDLAARLTKERNPTSWA